MASHDRPSITELYEREKARADREHAERFQLEKERGEMNEALKAEMARADAAESALAAANAELAKYRARPYATLAADLRAAEADLRAANARAEKAEKDLRYEANRSDLYASEVSRLENDLAAARRECEGLRKVLDVARAALESGQDLWPAIQQARAALSSEGESK